MESSLVGAISASVICGVLFIITICVVCYLIYRCNRQRDEKSSQQESLINGHAGNGHIPTVAQFVPIPVQAPRPFYQFPTMPARHMANYRPRYIEDRGPAGVTKIEGHSVVMKSQTYSGPYTTPSKGPVFYDVRQHGAPRANRSPLWTQKSQGEEMATMMLGEESPKMSVKQFHIETQSTSNRNSVHSENGHSAVEKRSSRYSDVRIPSPDADRMQYLFSSNQESSRKESLSQLANETRLGEITSEETTIQNGGVILKTSSKRQRRADEGSVMVLPPPDYD